MPILSSPVNKALRSSGRLLNVSTNFRMLLQWPTSSFFFLSTSPVSDLINWRLTVVWMQPDCNSSQIRSLSRFGIFLTLAALTAISPSRLFGDVRQMLILTWSMKSETAFFLLRSACFFCSSMTSFWYFLMLSFALRNYALVWSKVLRVVLILVL